MLIVSFKKANAYYDAMEARCYDGELIFLEEEKKLDKKLVFWALLFIIFLVGLWSLTK
jgi:cobalt/nickel transport system permease protein